LDRLTEIEMCVLMSTGYTLATAGLKLSQAGMAPEDPDMDDPVLPSTETALHRSASHSRHKYQNALGKLSPTEKEMMFPKHWGFFDVDSAPKGDWPFSPIQRMLSHPAVERKNAGIDELREQLKHSAYQFGVQRWWNSNLLTTVLLGLAAMAAFVYGCYVMIKDFVESGGVDEFGCRCYTQSAIFYVALFFVAVIFLAKPGYLGRLVWAGLLLPAFGGVHLFLIDPWLAYKGSQQRILGLFNASVSPEERIYSYAPRYVIPGQPKVLTPFDKPQESQQHGIPTIERELSVLRGQDDARSAAAHVEPLSASVVSASVDSQEGSLAMLRKLDSKQAHSDE